MFTVPADDVPSWLAPVSTSTGFETSEYACPVKLLTWTPVNTTVGDPEL